MNEMKSYVLTHKKLFLIVAAALVAVAVTAAFLCTAATKDSHKGAEAVPKGRIYDPPERVASPQRKYLYRTDLCREMLSSNWQSRWYQVPSICTIV